jgi:uncharacterized protein YkwD
MRWLVRCVPKWVAPRFVLGLLLTTAGIVGLLLIPPLFDRDVEERGGVYIAQAPAARCPSALTAAAVRCEINGIRRAAGLQPIRAMPKLRVAAQRHSNDMVRRRYFSHVSPSGSTVRERVKRAGYLRGVRGHQLGENIAWGSGSAATPAEIVKAWMQSPGHREIILTPAFEEVGVGIAGAAPQGGHGATYTLNVGRRNG